MGAAWSAMVVRADDEVYGVMKLQGCLPRVPEPADTLGASDLVILTFVLKYFDYGLRTMPYDQKLVMQKCAKVVLCDILENWCEREPDSGPLYLSLYVSIYFEPILLL